MALQKSYCIERKPLMLKDYLRDDLSSCSSNGFNSFPRRQCCTTIRFLLEIDLKTNNTKQLLKRSHSKATATKFSALQRASDAFISTAVKLLPFPSVQNRARKGLLPRSLSRKLLKKSFWRKADHKEEEECEIKGWKLFREFLEEQDPPSDQITYQSNTNTTTAITTTTTTTSNSSVSTSSCNDSNSNSNSWAESEFTADILRSSSGNSEMSIENDTVEGKNDLPENKVSNKVGERSTNTKDWPNVEKEQFSPVSVLDCPFEDEEICSPFQCRLARIEGTKQKLMQKIRRFECLAQLEPVDLEKRIALSELEDELLESPMQPCSMSIYNNDMFDENDEENETYERACGLVKLIEAKIPLSSFKFKEENLILDFFTERIEESNANASSVTRGIQMEHDLLKIAEDWINGQPQELIFGWEVKDGRKAYVRDMENNERWKKLDQEKEEVTLELELDIFTSLVEELLHDLF